MVFAFDGFDPNGVPIYVNVPHGDQDIAKPQEAATSPKQVASQPASTIPVVQPAEDAIICAVPCAYFVIGIIGTFLFTYWLTSS